MQVSLRAARVNANLTQHFVSDEMGVANSTLVNWEKGKTFPTVPQLMRLCKMYHCSPSDIFIPETLPLSKRKTADSTT